MVRRKDLPLLHKNDFTDLEILAFDDVVGRNLTRLRIVQENNLSHFVKFRLWLARQLALKKFDKVFQH